MNKLEEYLKQATDLEQGMMEGYAFCITASAVIAIIIMIGYHFSG